MVHVALPEVRIPSERYVALSRAAKKARDVIVAGLGNAFEKLRAVLRRIVQRLSARLNRRPLRRLPSVTAMRAAYRQKTRRRHRRRSP